MIRTGARLGAATLALGLSLVGPHGVAAAEDGPQGDSRAAGADSGDTQQRAKSTPRRGAGSGTHVSAQLEPSATATAPSADAERRTVESQRSGTQRAGPGRHKSVDDGLGREPLSSATPKAPAAAVTPFAVARAKTPPDEEPAAAVLPAAAPVAVAATVVAGDPLPTPVIAKAQACGVCGAATALPAAAPSVTALVRGARFLDDIGNFLRSLPANPVNELLSGALLLLRRNLFPTVPTIPRVSVGNVMVVENSPQAVFTVKLDRPYASAVTVGYATGDPPENPGTEPADLVAPAVAGADYLARSGVLTFAPGQTSQQVHVAVLADPVAEVSETFSMDLFAATLSEVTPVRLASATATIIDDDRVSIDVNPNFAYGDALLATIFSDLAYNHRDDADFGSRVQATGWEGIGVSAPGLGAGGFSPVAGGYGVRDGLAMQSYAFAGKRTAADGTVQFVVAFEGSNGPFDEPADWIVNASQYGWSRYYASLEPLVSEVVRQMMEAQQDDAKTQLILTGHSLGGASAMMAFADFLAPEGNLWPGTATVLAAGGRVLDSVDVWSPETRTALLAATTVYTFGAPSILIEPNKPGLAEAAAFAATAAGSGLLAALALLPRAIGALTVDDKKLPDLSAVAGIDFGTRVFQFEHANTSWLPPYPGDIVAQIGSRDPGTVLQINLDNDIHTAYTGLVARFIPGSTHFMDRYRESITRLVTNRRLIKSPNKLSGSSPQLPQTGPGQGSDTRNDFFVNTSDDGGAGNDLFVFSKAGSYSANGDAGSDAYSISDYGVSLLIDGAKQSGRDTVVFDLAGTPGVTYYNSGSGPRNDIAVFSVTGANDQLSSVTVTGWDQWQVSDVMQVIKPADGRWTLDVWTDIERGQQVEISPAGEIPISVL